MKWIPVELEKPRFCDDVLFTDGNKVYKGWLETHEVGEDQVFYNDTSRMREDRWPENVTHWMHLPNHRSEIMEEEDTIVNLIERIEELETQLLSVQHIIRFHGLNDIDRKYRKTFPNEKEYPFFEANGFKKEPSGFDPTGGMGYLHKMPDEEEREWAKQKMLNYAPSGKRYFSGDDSSWKQRQKEEEYWNKKREDDTKQATSGESSDPSPPGE